MGQSTWDQSIFTDKVILQFKEGLKPVTQFVTKKLLKWDGLMVPNHM